MLKKLFIILIIIFSYNASLYDYNIIRDIDKVYKKYLEINIPKTSMRFIGCKYKWGAEGEKEFDCSGFVQYVYKQYNIDLPRSSIEQYNMYMNNNLENIYECTSGNLVFFRDRSNKYIGHVGIIIENNNDSILFIHASSKGVNISSLDDLYYKERFVGTVKIH